MGCIHLVRSAKAATAAMSSIGVQTAKTIEMSTEHHGGLDQHL